MRLIRIPRPKRWWLAAPALLALVLFVGALATRLPRSAPLLQTSPPVGVITAPSKEGPAALPFQSSAAEDRAGPQDGSQAAAPAARPAPGGGTQEGQSQITDRMIAYNTAVSLEVQSVPDAVNAISSLAEGAGGFVAGTSLRFQNDKEYASLTLRVPATAYHDVMNSLRKMAAKVTSETGSARDVTEEFTDLGAQLRNYEATEAQYLELLRRANTIDEILKVQNKLTEVRGQIERTKGRMNLLQRTADMATIAVNLTPAVGARAQDPQQVWDPAQTVQEAWEQSLVVVRAFADITLRVVVFSWWLAPLALMAWGFWSLSRRPRPAA